MVDKRFADALTGALAQLGWETEDLEDVRLVTQLVTTGVDALPQVIVRGATPADSTGVLDMCCPFVRHPTDQGVLAALTANGVAAAEAGALFSSYVGTQRTGYLGGFVRIPVPTGFWSTPALTPLICTGGRSLTILRARIPGLKDWCESQGYPLGEAIFPDVRGACPGGILEASS